MIDLLYTLMHPLPNAIMTGIMGVLFIYWLVSFIFGGMDLDLDVGFDSDVDINIEVGGFDGRAIETGDPSSHVEPGAFIKFLDFVNVGKMPFMVVFTIFMFIIWIGSLITTKIFGMTSWGWLSIFILIPLIIVSIFLTKLATAPLVKIFHAMGYKGEESIDFLGRSGKMLSNIQGDKIGTAEFIVDKNPMKLNVKSINGEEIKYGEYVIAEKESEDKKYYFVSKELSLRNIN